MKLWKACALLAGLGVLSKVRFGKAPVDIPGTAEYSAARQAVIPGTPERENLIQQGIWNATFRTW